MKFENWIKRHAHGTEYSQPVHLLWLQTYFQEGYWINADTCVKGVMMGYCMICGLSKTEVATTAGEGR